MISTETIRLKNHQNLTDTTAHGWGAIGLGSILLLMGLWTAIIATGRFEWARATSGIAAWIAGWFGVIFSWFGCSTVLYGWRGLRRERRAHTLRFTKPFEPWMQDHPWDATGANGKNAAHAGRALYSGLAFAAFLLPLHLLLFSDELDLLVVRIFLSFVTLISDLAILLIFWHGLTLLARRIRYGAGRLRFERFPFFTGGELRARLSGVERLRDADTLTATLRFVKECAEDTGDSTWIVAYQLYAETQTINLRSPHANDIEIALAFALPAGDYATELMKRPPRYWQLEVAAGVGKPAFRTTFIVPVYAAPGAWSATNSQLDLRPTITA